MKPDPLLSVIIPTYQERENILILCPALSRELAGIPHEILIVDDNSQDGIVEVVMRLRKAKHRVRLIVRKENPGLSAAVIDGLKQAKGEYCCVMDADLSHPPTAIMPMLRRLQGGRAKFCLGSRYIVGSRLDKRWTFKRRFMSYIATLLAMPLVRIKDPMSGFFVLAAEHIPPLHRLSPLGYKIALEIVVKGDLHPIYEEPIHFKERVYGRSKMNFRIQFFFLRHLRRLYKYKFPTFSEFVLFSMVGTTGFAVDVLFYYALQIGMGDIAARGFSFWIAASWNWYLNRVITFSDAFKSKKIRQWLLFIFASTLGFSINWGLYVLLTLSIDFFAIYKLLALILGVLAGLGTNFMFSKLFVFRVLDEEV